MLECLAAVLSIAKLTPGQEGYYERSVAAGVDDYYAGKGESPGIWAGRGARELELEGVVEEGELGKLVRGLHPLTGAQLRRHPPARTITVERIDPESGERRVEEKRLAPVAGFDLVFGAPKSVSLLHALGDEETRLAVVQAHAAAWQAALSYLEAEACVTRRGRNGVIRERASGFVAAAYQHRTSRAQDPHLHTHVLVANMAKSPSDGEWRALDGEALLSTYRLAAGYLYQAHLRSELSRSLGVAWEAPVKGMAEIAGVPEGALRAFSRRRGQVLEYLAGRGTAGFYAGRVAALETRERKEEVDLVRLRAEWRARAAEHGLGRIELEALLHRSPQRELTASELLGLAERLLGPEGLTERRSAFSEPELLMAWAEAHEQGVPAERLRRICARFLSLAEVEWVGQTPQPGRPAFYSTRELLAVERATLALVRRGRDTGAPFVSADAVERIIASRPERFALAPDQEAMVRAAATSRDGVVAVVGRAGAGKTTALHALAQALATAGIPVLGAAPSGAAAEKLGDETGLSSTTLHRLLLEAERKGGLPRGCVLVLDEAGTAETRVLARVLALVERVEGKAILVGDPHQLPAVGAGGFFAAIVEREGALELAGNRRQRDRLEREALEAVRRGLGREYLAFAERQGRLFVSDDPLALRTRLLADWWRAARRDLVGTVMIAQRRRDVAELNAVARALMDAEGRLGRERLEIAGREFRAGDRIVCLRNSDALGVRNGTRGTIEQVDRARGRLHVRTDRGDDVCLDRRYLEAGDVRHAYALTGHASQGLTVERAFVLGADAGRLQEWGYVALSRAREETRLYVRGGELEPETHAQELGGGDPLSRFAQALESSGSERLALEQGPLAAGPKAQTRLVLERSERDRLIEQQRLATEKIRARGKERLAEAERRLERLPFYARGARREELRREIARERAALRLADEKLVGLELRSREAQQRPPLARARPEVAVERDRTPQLERTRAPAQLELGIDL
jgi:conjugative relaxase-like TrwC/TraI family protein